MHTRGSHRRRHRKTSVISYPRFSVSDSAFTVSSESQCEYHPAQVAGAVLRLGYPSGCDRAIVCVCGSLVSSGGEQGRGREAAHPRALGQCLHFECRQAPARVRVWRCEGRRPLPHHFLRVEIYLPYLTYLACECVPRVQRGCLSLY